MVEVHVVGIEGEVLLECMSELGWRFLSERVDLRVGNEFLKFGEHDGLEKGRCASAVLYTVVVAEE